MKNTLIGILLAAGASIAATGSARAENAMYSCVNASGSTELTNVPTNSACEKLFAYAAPEPAPPTAAAIEITSPSRPSAAPAAAATVAPVAPAPAPVRVSSSAKGSKPLLAQRRDDVIQQTRDAYGASPLTAGVNPAVNRRYLMTNKSDYQRAIGLVSPQ